MIKNKKDSSLSIKLGFWSALFGVIFIAGYTVCFGAIVASNPIFVWTDLEGFVAYVAEYPSPFPDIARFCIVMVSILFVVVLNCVDDLVTAEQQVLTRIALSFGLGFTILTGAFYFIQISGVRVSLIKGDLAGLEQVIQANPYSAMSALNMLAWSLFLGMSSLCLAPVFLGGRLERLLRVTFVFNGIFCLLSFVGYVFEIILLLFVTVNLGTGGALLVGLVGLTVWFWRQLG